ncbi:hypothetical protein ZHAS_00001577 [Anopheles sinensis]|uniref:Uncharacterized protein n=1 Tax=Anopheles sinensis TaxID=74873 RepID=A0A084VBH8_ANOSI|nr:hypothetical protein ZHAS_00001577 [Anopheles sinensis]
MTSATAAADGANGNGTLGADGGGGGETDGLRKSLTAAGSAGYPGSSASPNAIRNGRPGSGLSLSVLGAGCNDEDEVFLSPSASHRIRIHNVLSIRGESRQVSARQNGKSLSLNDTIK